MEINSQQKKILIGVGSVVGVLFLYFILAWSMNFWPFKGNQGHYNSLKDEIYSETDATTLSETVFTKAAGERKAELKTQVIENKLEKFINDAEKLVKESNEPKDETKKTYFTAAKTALETIKQSKTTLEAYNDDFFSEANKQTNQPLLLKELKKTAIAMKTFTDKIKDALELDAWK